mgnify:CR=1 FL=1
MKHEIVPNLGKSIWNGRLYNVIIGLDRVLTAIRWTDMTFMYCYIAYLLMDVLVYNGINVHNILYPESLVQLSCLKRELMHYNLNYRTKRDIRQVFNSIKQSQKL